jgi:hypothetical protein
MRERVTVTNLRTFEVASITHTGVSRDVAYLAVQATRRPMTFKPTPETGVKVETWDARKDGTWQLISTWYA